MQHDDDVDDDDESPSAGGASGDVGALFAANVEAVIGSTYLATARLVT
jgi:hypothetical protein